MNFTISALKRPVTTVMIFLCIAVIGAISTKLLPLEFFPELDLPFVVVNVPYPGSTPEEIEREITRPIEEALATINDVNNMRSYSRENSTDIVLEFDWGVNTDIKALETAEKMDGILHLLPEDMERYFIFKFNTTDMEMLALRLSSKRDLSNSYDMLNRNIKRRLERIEGVS
ncbi:MAG: efflux RND transporter permease subunit, partial [Calditrichia bacterium]|nr:efflux RND transporter permease subunit [Calditrichia bacterium]